MQSLHQRSQPYISVRCQYTSDLYPNLHNPSLNLPGTFVTLLAAHQCRPSLVFISLLCTCIYNDCLRKVHLQLLLTLARPSNRYTLLFIYNFLKFILSPFAILLASRHNLTVLPITGYYNTCYWSIYTQKCGFFVKCRPRILLTMLLGLSIGPCGCAFAFV